MGFIIAYGRVYAADATVQLYDLDGNDIVRRRHRTDYCRSRR